MDHAAGAVEALAQVPVAFARLRIKLARRILIGCGVRASFRR
jgi:hypothetical protein